MRVLLPFAPITNQIQLRAEAQRRGDKLVLQFDLRGDLKRFLIPEAAANPIRSDRLWEHTCFEAFIGVLGSDSYREVNFSPSGHWASYRFSGYRAEMVNETEVIPRELTCERTEQQLLLNCHLDARTLKGTALDVALTAVLEESSQQKSYWALNHVSDRPDFHQRKSFLLRL